MINHTCNDNVIYKHEKYINSLHLRAYYIIMHSYIKPIFICIIKQSLITVGKIFCFYLLSLFVFPKLLLLNNLNNRININGERGIQDWLFKKLSITFVEIGLEHIWFWTKFFVLITCFGIDVSKLFLTKFRHFRQFTYTYNKLVKIFATTIFNREHFYREHSVVVWIC